MSFCLALADVEKLNHLIYTLLLKPFLSLHRFIVLNLSFLSLQTSKLIVFSIYRFIVSSFHRFIAFLVRNIEFILSVYRFIVVKKKIEFFYRFIVVDLSFYRCRSFYRCVLSFYRCMCKLKNDFNCTFHFWSRISELRMASGKLRRGGVAGLWII